MSILRHILINGFFAICIYYGYFEDVEGAQNIALFMAWLCVFVSIFLFTDKGQEMLKKESKTKLFNVTDRIFDTGVTAAFVYSGAWITGAAYFIQMLLIWAAKDQAVK